MGNSAANNRKCREQRIAPCYENKCEVVRHLLDRLDEDDAVVQLRELAEDADWEVRHEVALAIVRLPNNHLAWFVERLINDPNAYVQRAVHRALDARRREVRAESHRREKHERVAKRVQELESRTKRQVGRICREHGEELIAQVAHDLRALATRLKPACYQLVAASGDLRPRAANTVLTQLSMFEKLTEDLQFFSEPLRIEKRDERMAEVVQAAIEAAQSNMAKAGLETPSIRIVAEMNAGIVVPMARHLVQIALTNVIQNACEAFAIDRNEERNAEIRIDVGIDDGMVTITVVDNGPGMAEEDLAVVTAFLPGRRNLSKPSSTGFGLPIAARNIAAHDGHLEMKSCAGVGTRVTITLPLTTDEEKR